MAAIKEFLAVVTKDSHPEDEMVHRALMKKRRFRGVYNFLKID